MSLRLKLVVSCTTLAVVAMAVGGWAHSWQRDADAMTARVVDIGVLAFDRLRGAELSLVALKADEALHAGPIAEGERRLSLPPELVDRLAATMADLAAIRALLPRDDIYVSIDAELQGAELHLDRAWKSRADMSRRKFFEELDRTANDIAAAVREARPGLAALHDAAKRSHADGARRLMAGAVATLMLAVASVLVLTRSAVLPLRRAERLARAIASGKLHNRIDIVEGAEGKGLLEALASVQSGMAEKLRHVESTRLQQASGYTETITTQNARFQAALDNMSQALCLFDRDRDLVVVNRRFEEMFGKRRIGMGLEEVRQDEILKLTLAANGTGTFLETLKDGRTLALSRRGVVGGGFVATMEDVTERFREDEVMRHLASHDPLTDLPNRMRFREHLEAALLDRGVTVLGLDLDGFKTVNDALGHPIGDKLLQEVAVRLRACLEPGELVARIGGDEFAVVLPVPHDDEVCAARAEAFIAVVGQPFEIEGHWLSIGVSVGIATSSPDANPALSDEMLMRVDLALYSAKGEGKNTYRFYRREMTDKLQRRREMEISLRAAVENGAELELFYQPFVEADRGMVSGFEALLRWRRPGGMVSPGEFIPIAEDVGLMHPIGLWVLRTACLQAMTWPEHLTVSVNLSPIQFRNVDLFRDIRAIVEETGIEPSRLQLEVTESLMLENADAILATLTDLRSLGIRISMDDFGTGYSSLGYLTRYPFDKVKIDQSFVRRMEMSQNLAVIRSVINLSEALGIAVIAEGVETEEHYAALKAEGCPEMQGYHFSRPVPPSDIPAVLMRTYATSLRGEAKRAGRPARAGISAA
ncbi:putative bifunctional diguanylate cyclase/phosphodiesterase [Aureimonas leprariae]|nr:EAL domain-containing protein [Aureimonas leprariae]